MFVNESEDETDDSGNEREFNNEWIKVVLP
jgi:hypothetical protein